MARHEPDPIYTGNIFNTGVISGLVGTTGTGLLAALVGSIHTENDLWLYLYEDGTFSMTLPNGEKLGGTYEFRGELLVFAFNDKTLVKAEPDGQGNAVYSITTESGYSIEFMLTSDFLTKVRTDLEGLKG